MAKKQPIAVPWTQDAIDLDLPQVFDELRLLLHENAEIRQFLNETYPGSRETKFLIFAPKGFGKTLLLKSKRIAVQQMHQGTTLIPHGNMADRPFGRLPPERHVIHTSSTLTSWKTLWSISIQLSVLHTVRRGILANTGNEYATRLSKRDDVALTPGDIFSELIGGSDDFYQRSVFELGSRLVPYYRAIQSPVAVFIDNVDDYFLIEEEHTRDLSSHEDDKPSIGYDETSLSTARRMWVLSQIGLAEAIRELRTQSTQVKIFAALRKEAAMRGYEKTVNTQQLFGIAVDLSYGREELKDIFRRNIARMHKSRLHSPRETDPVARLVGPENIRMTHTYTGKSVIY